jgi:hypothetical protein
MRLLDLQQRHQEIGRIRCGISEGTGRTGRNGKEIRRPVKLGTFVLSSPNQRVIHAAAGLYGGDVEVWERQWRVITPVSELSCSVPGGDAALNQAWEMWNAGLCVRRCDGATEQLRQAPCLCPADHLVRSDLAGRGEACKVKSRINLILPDLPGLGVWRLETGSWNAAVETASIAELLGRARDTGTVVPAVLRLERRESKRLVDIGQKPSRDGKGERVQAREFYVPVLDPLPTLREMTELAGRPLAAALPPPPSVMKAISAGQAPTPAYGVPAVQPPAAWVAEAQVEEARPSAAPIPPVAQPPDSPAPGQPQSPQDVADLAAAADCDLRRWQWLWDGSLAAPGWLDEYVSTNPGQPDAVMDTLRVHLEEQRARIEEGR